MFGVFQTGAWCVKSLSSDTRVRPNSLHSKKNSIEWLSWIYHDQLDCKVLFTPMKIRERLAEEKESITPEFNHLALSVKDLQKVTAFYKEVLLLEPIEEPFKEGRHSWFSLGSGLSLHLVANAKETNEHPLSNHFCVSISTLDDYIDHLNKMNVPYYNSRQKPHVKQIRPDGVQQIYIKDPEGHWIEINDEKGSK